jgi:hypothetical protein
MGIKNSFVNGVPMRLDTQNPKTKSITVGMKLLGVMMIDILKDCGKRVNTHFKKNNYEMHTIRPPYGTSTLLAAVNRSAGNGRKY